MREYDIVIGLEVHVQLKSVTKMFCTNSASYFGTSPNSHTCPVCLGLPGALPVPNKKALESALKIGLALNCSINARSRFDRKNYFYPDLPKGFQISQYDLPIAQNGWIFVGNKKIRINRAHLEEDTGKLIHAALNKQKVSLIDFNRSGVPLMEVVSEPDIESPAEAKAYAKKLHQIMRYLDVSDADMEKAGMRFDANISVKPKGQKNYGVKVEVKNINSFRFLEKALVYEAARQIRILEAGGKLMQETRGWVETKGETVSQRTKETSPDYRYFPEPDLPPLVFSKETMAKLKLEIPELPDSRKNRFKEQLSLSDNDAEVLTEDKKTADWFELALKDYLEISKNQTKEIATEKAKTIANWVIGELRRLLNEQLKSIDEINLQPASLAELLTLIDKGEVSNQTAKEVFAEMFSTGNKPTKIISEKNLGKIIDRETINNLVVSILKENQEAVDDYKKGKQASLSYLIGQVMRRTAGKADPFLVRQILEKNLK